MLIQTQQWHDKTRYIIIDECASVHLELFDTAQDFGGTAFIWALWTNPDCRRKGHAERMLDRAEQIAAENGHDAVYLEWLEKDTPCEILDWYHRRGYQEQEFSGKGDYVLLKKSLTDKIQQL